jgi:hypothetical protein
MSLKNLLYAAGIIKSVFVVGDKDKNLLFDTLSKMLNTEERNIESGSKSNFDDWLAKMNRDASYVNVNQPLKPQITRTTFDPLESIDEQP